LPVQAVEQQVPKAVAVAKAEPLLPPAVTLTPGGKAFRLPVRIESVQPGKVRISAGGVTLRDFGWSDLDDPSHRARLDALFANDEHVKFMSIHGGASQGFTERMINSFISTQSASPRKSWGLAIENSEHEIVGFIALTLEKDSAGATQASVGYIVNPTEEGKGYASDASAALVNFAFNQTDAWRVVAEIRTENLSSVRSAEKVGFSPTAEVSHNKNMKGQTFPFAVFEIARDTFKANLPAK
jgi:RimJ/RimL family protein N-acetyltransferase